LSTTGITATGTFSQTLNVTLTSTSTDQLSLPASYFSSTAHDSLTSTIPTRRSSDLEAWSQNINSTDRSSLTQTTTGTVAGSDTLTQTQTDKYSFTASGKTATGTYSQTLNDTLTSTANDQLSLPAFYRTTTATDSLTS